MSQEIQGKQGVREDDERCGRSREVRTSEIIGQINDFMNRDRRVSIETLSTQFNVSVGAVHTIIREELKMRKICAKFVPRVLREDQRERRCNDSKEMVELINGSPSYLQPGLCSLRLLAIPKAQGKPQRQSLFHNRGHERGFDEGPKHVHTRRLPGDFLEVVGTVQQVH